MSYSDAAGASPSRRAHAARGCSAPYRAGQTAARSAERLLAVDDHALAFADGKLQIGVALRDLLGRLAKPLGELPEPVARTGNVDADRAVVDRDRLPLLHLCDQPRRRVDALGEGEFQRRLGVDAPLLLLPRAHAAYEHVDAGVRRLYGDGEGKAEFDRAPPVRSLHKKGRHGDALDVDAVVAAHDVCLGALQDDRLQRIRKVDRRRKRRAPGDALGELRRLPRALALVLRIGEQDAVGAGKGVRHAADGDLLVDDARRPERERRVDARSLFLVGIGIERDLGHGDGNARLAARLRRVGRDVDRKGDEPLERDRIFAAQGEQSHEHLAFGVQHARRAGDGGKVYRLGVLQNVADHADVKVVLYFRRAVRQVGAEEVDGIAAADQLPAREIVKGLFAEYGDVRADERGHEDARALPAHGDVLHRGLRPHRAGGHDTRVLGDRRELHALFRTADMAVRVLIDDGKVRPSVIADFAVARLRPRKMHAHVRRQHRRFGEAALESRLRRERKEFSVAAEGLRLRFDRHIHLLLFSSTGLGTLCAVLGAGLVAACNTLGIQSAADDVVTHTGQVLDTAAAEEERPSAPAGCGRCRECKK